jgi:hypothetical protein
MWDVTVRSATFASVLGELVSIGLVLAAPARCASEYTLEKSLFPASVTADCGLFISLFEVLRQPCVDFG